MTRFTLAVLVLAAGAARAFDLPGEGDKVQPCRPTVAATAELSAPGQLELETGYLQRTGGGSTERSIPTLVKLSLTHSLQLQVGTTGPLFRSGAAGVGAPSTSLGLKAAAHAGESTVLALSATAVLPPTGGTDGVVTAYASQDLPLGLHTDLNLGVNLPQLSAAQPWAALSLSHELPLNLGVFAEAWGAASAGERAPKDGGALFGLSWSPLSWVTFDAGADVGFFPEERSRSLFVGLTFVPVNLWGGAARHAQARAAAEQKPELKVASAEHH